MMDISCLSAPKITYPCIWEYKAFIPLKTDENAFFKELLTPHEYKLKASKQNAKYKSFNVSLLVSSDAHRLEIFALLKENCAFVL